MSYSLAHPTLIDLIKLCREAREDEKDQYFAITGHPWEWEQVAVEHYNRQGVKMVLLCGDEPVVAGGYDLITDGVWQSWMVGTTANWEEHWFAITKYTRKFMESLLHDSARRLQTVVLSSRKKTCDWYRKGLKMEYEGTMRGFCHDGQDVDMYARIDSDVRR